MADLDVVSAVERARAGRVDLGAFTLEELWRAGVEVRGPKPRRDPPPASRLPLGPRAFRQLDDPPMPWLTAKLALAGTELAHVQRDAVLIDRSVTKVVETRGNDEPRTLSLQTLDGVLDEVLDEGGVARPTTAPLVTRLFLVFPLRFKWAKGKGLLPSQRLFVAKAPMPKDEAIWLDVTIRTGPGSAPTVSQQRSPRAASFPELAPGADADAIKNQVNSFFRDFWDLPGPGPRP